MDSGPFVFTLLISGLVVVLVLIAFGLLFRPFTKKKVADVISEELNKHQLTLKQVIKPMFPDTGPFKDAYPMDIVNSMAAIMGLYPDYIAYRKLGVTTIDDKEKIIWIKIEFDILKLKNVELKEE